MRYSAVMGSPARLDPPPDRRLKPAMRSRKLQALDFIKQYVAKWSHSPSLGEIAAELGISKKRVHELVHQLSLERQIEIVAGKTRGIRLPQSQPMSEADVILRLKELGFTVDYKARSVQPPLTKTGLPGLPFLGHND